MTSRSGRDAFVERFSVPRGTLEQLDRFVDLLIEASNRQNLIAASTVSSIWDRHMLDSAQVLRLAEPNSGVWLDVGSGAGLPGMVNAIMSSAQHVLLEPRKLRADFLKGVVAALDLGRRVSVVQSRVEPFVHAPFSVITARAFATLAKTLGATIHLADAGTTWLLHKGRRAAAEIDQAAESFSAHYEPIVSETADDAFVVRCRNVVALR